MVLDVICISVAFTACVGVLLTGVFISGCVVGVVHAGSRLKQAYKDGRKHEKKKWKKKIKKLKKKEC